MICHYTFLLVDIYLHGRKEGNKKEFFMCPASYTQFCNIHLDKKKQNEGKQPRRTFETNL